MPPKPKAKQKPKKGTATLALQTKKKEPDSSRSSFIWPVQRTAGVRITEDTALTLGAVWACVKIISESLAGVPWLVYRMRQDGGMDVLRDHAISWLLDTESSPETPAFQFRETMIAHALTWGNGYAEIERDMAGRPVNLWTLTPDRVHPTRVNRDGRIIYEVSNPSGGVTVLERDEMFHLRGLGFDGLVGYSVIQLAARVIGAGIALDQSVADFFGNDSTPGGTLNHPGRLSKQAHDRLIDDWEKRHRGPANRRRVAVLEEGLEWKQTGLPPEDSQLLEERQFTPSEICRWFGVPPHKIGDLTRATFSNIEHQAIAFVNDTLRPWAERLETEADIKLFGRNNRGVLKTIMDLEELKRGDMASQAEYSTKMVNWGIFSVNDARQFLNRNPIGPDGDIRIVPVNMVPLDKVGQAPTQEPANPNRSDTLAPVFEDVFRRILAREAGRAKEAMKSGVDKAAWLAKVGPDHLGYVMNVLRPPVASLALSRQVPVEKVSLAIESVAARHLEDFKERFLSADIDSCCSWESQSATVGRKWMDQLNVAVEVLK